MDKTHILLCYNRIMEILVEKSKTPSIWLDTSAIIKITKARLGRKVEQSTQYLQLYEMIIQQVAANRLICPEGGQEEEIEEGKFLVKECIETISRMSEGVRFFHEHYLQICQENFVMTGFIRNLPNVVLHFDDVIEVSKTNLSQKNSAKTKKRKETPTEVIDLRAKLKGNQYSFLTDRHQNQREVGRTYEEALEQAYLAPIQMYELTRAYLVEQRPLPQYVIPAMVKIHRENLMNRMQIWNLLGGKPEGFVGLIGFWHSDSYRAIPIIDIACRLYALLDVANDRVQTGDPGDIGFIAAALPYCHFVFVDNATKRKLQELELDQKYQSKVYREKDLPDLIDQLKDL